MKNKNKLMIGCIAGGAVLAALLVAFFVLSKEYFGGSFSPKAVLSNTDVSALSVDEALDAMNQSKGFEIQVQAKDKNYDGLIRMLDILLNLFLFQHKEIYL